MHTCIEDLPAEIVHHILCALPMQYLICTYHIKLFHEQSKWRISQLIRGSVQFFYRHLLYAGQRGAINNPVQEWECNTSALLLVESVHVAEWAVQHLSLPVKGSFCIWYLAQDRDDPSTLQWLLDRGYLNMDRDSPRAVWVAAKNGRVKLLQWLFDKGAQADRYHLLSAVQAGSVESVDLILPRIVDPTVFHTSFHISLCHRACKSQQPQMLRRVLDLCGFESPHVSGIIADSDSAELCRVWIDWCDNNGISRGLPLMWTRALRGQRSNSWEFLTAYTAMPRDRSTLRVMRRSEWGKRWLMVEGVWW